MEHSPLKLQYQPNLVVGTLNSEMYEGLGLFIPLKLSLEKEIVQTTDMTERGKENSRTSLFLLERQLK